MIFVLSTGRSGTKSIADYLDLAESVTAVHEADPLFIDEVVELLRGERSVESLAGLLAASRAPRVGALEYAESNHILSYAVPSVELAFPKARYVWLVRDGRDVVSSLDIRGVLRNQPDHDVPGEWLMKRFRLSWFGDVGHDMWQVMDPFEKACWYWAKTNDVIEEALGLLEPNRWMLLHLEYIDSERRMLAEKFDLPQLAALVPPILNQSRRAGAKWEEWSAAQRSTFARVCGPRMDRMYPGWRTADGVWQQVWTPPLHVRAQLRAQALARSLVFSPSGPSRVLHRFGALLPDPMKRRAKRLLGVH